MNYTLLKRFFLFVFLQIGLAGSMSSCLAPDPMSDLEPEERDLYVTNRDVSADFSNYKTYFLLDSVQSIIREGGVTDTVVQNAPLILETIDIELQNVGFAKAATSQEADLGIAVSVLRFSEEAPALFYPYVNGAGFTGYVSPALYGFPDFTFVFPTYYGYYEIQAGSISIDMYDLKTARQPGQTTINVIWSAVLAGSLTASQGNQEQRIVNAIKAAFAQSPYLKEGK
ncbi:MAG TPA: DUF4136 domain-containing protein [Cytophagaceae bacterium]